MRCGYGRCIFLAFLFIIFVFLYSVYSLVAYVVQGVTLLKISKKLGVSHGWMAFVPVACHYLLGKMSEEDCKHYHPNKKVKKWRVIYPIFFGIYIVLNVLGGAFFFIAPLELTKADMEWDRFVAITDLLEGVGMLIFLVSALLWCIVTSIVLYKFYHVLAGKSATWMLVVTILVPVSQLVIMLILAFSKKYPVECPYTEAEAIEAKDEKVPAQVEE